MRKKTVLTLLVVAAVIFICSVTVIGAKYYLNVTDVFGAFKRY